MRIYIFLLIRHINFTLKPHFLTMENNCVVLFGTKSPRKKLKIKLDIKNGKNRSKRIKPKQ